MKDEKPTQPKLPVLFEVNKQRGSLLRGSTIKIDKGTSLSVGSGKLIKVNGVRLFIPDANR